MKSKISPFKFATVLSSFCLISSVTLVQANQVEPVRDNQRVLPGDTPVNLSSSEWADIKKQIDTAQYRAFSNNKGGFLSSNASHGWRIHYASDGTTTLTPHDKTAKPYHLKMKLNAFGYGNLQALERPQNISEQDFSVTYQWNDNLRELWINSDEKLEQWFMVERKPEGASKGKPLTMQMALESGLQARQKGNTLYFTEPSGTNITYNKLKVWDASGRELPAKMQLATNRISLLVDDSSARYPLTIDPSFEQHSMLKASNAGSSDHFGYSVAISGDTLVVGANQERSSSTGVNGDETDNSAVYSGAAYVFIRTGSGWTQQAYLKASNPEAYDYFGYSVAVSGDTIVVGAYGEDSNSTTSSGDQTDNSITESGAAYVFTRTGSDWAQQAYLKPNNTGANDYFGSSVGVSGNTVVVAANGEDGGATGVNGNPHDDSASNSGAVYVFERVGGSFWILRAYLKASNTGSSDQFGYSAAISGDTIVVGAKDEDSNSTGVNGDQNNNSGSRTGAAYVFTRAGSSWTQQSYLKPSTLAEDYPYYYYFGSSVAISDDTIGVGAPGESSNSTGVNGDENNNLANGSGAAYVFTRAGSDWTQQAYLKASNTEEHDNFGVSVAVSGDTLMVGADEEDSNSTGVNGDQSNNSASNAGAAYVFTRTGSDWAQQAYLKASNSGANDKFGRSMALSGDNSIIGAHLEDSDSNGVNNVTDSGAAYLFAIVPPHILPDNQWQQISLPMEPPTGSNSVADIFGNSALGEYGTLWIMYRYDTVSDEYVALVTTDTLVQGVGYWIIQINGSDKTLDMPAGSRSTPTSFLSGCPAGKSCFNMPALGTEAESAQWNMIGYPYGIGTLLSDTRITAYTTNCISGCTLDTALADNLVHNQLWNYGGSSYNIIDTAAGTMDPWLAYWAASLDGAEGMNPTFLIPKP